MKRSKTVSINLLLMVSSLLFALGLAEVSLRLFWPQSFMAPQKPTGAVWQELLHRPSPIPGLAYELTPNMTKFSLDALIRTNSHGMRDQEPIPMEDSSVFRIVVLGDSFTFGFGVENDETYPNVLEDLLNQSHASEGQRFDVLNFGVGGYSTRDEAIQLKHKGMAWKPDLIIIGYVLNDPEVVPIQPLHSYYKATSWWQYSHLMRLLARKKRILEVRRYGDGNYVKYLHAERGPTWPTVVQAFREIRDNVQYTDAKVLVVIFPFIRYTRQGAAYPYKAIHRQVADVATGNGFDVLDLYPAFRQVEPEKLMLSSDDDHPSRLGHRMAAEEIYKRLLTDYKGEIEVHEETPNSQASPPS